MRPIYKYALILAVITLLFFLAAEREMQNYEKHVFYLEGDTLECVVNIEGGMYLKRGHTVGFHFDLLKKFSKQERCYTNVRPGSGDTTIWRALMVDSIDVIVIDSKKEVIPEEYQAEVISSISLNNNEDVWVVKKSNYRLMQSLNYWMGHFVQTKDYGHLINNYYKKYRTFTTPYGHQASLLSPYDHIIKKYAAKIDWDWRLLAALIYQESKFSIDAKSSRGAHGLMQIKSSTAKQFKVENVYDPEQNIMAGSMLLKRLQKMYTKDGIDSMNRVKFVLASYNAGEGRIEDCRTFAQYKGVDHNNWNEVKTVIPLMRKNEIVELLKFGSFKGVETIRFVEQVLDRYEEYKGLVKK